jgi:hypothetical protein
MERSPEVEIGFFVGQNKYAVRRWPSVPRVGDQVMLGAGKDYPADAFGKAAFVVVRVVWGVEAVDAHRYDPQAVNIEVEPI